MMSEAGLRSDERARTDDRREEGARSG